jgi:hypothetical protein
MSFWSYPFHPPIAKEFQLDLGQGDTPLEPAPDEIKKLVNIDQLFFKREDQNPHGSFKDRAIAYQMSYLQSIDAKYCVLSSSGNAAISCCAFAKHTNIKPIILVSPDIPKNKLSQIIKYKPFLLTQSANARRLANYINKKYHIPVLNPSKDIKASISFETLGQEIYSQNPNCDAIFSYSTSGASLTGIYNYYQQNNLPIPKLFASQISYSSSPSTLFYRLSNANIIKKVIQQTNGSFQFTFQPETNKVQKILKQNNINSSLEGASATQLAIQKSIAGPLIHNAIIIISGTEHELLDIDPNFPKHQAKTREEIDIILKQQKIE